MLEIICFSPFLKLLKELFKWRDNGSQFHKFGIAQTTDLSPTVLRQDLGTSQIKAKQSPNETSWWSLHTNLGTQIIRDTNIRVCVNDLYTKSIYCSGKGVERAEKICTVSSLNIQHVICYQVRVWPFSCRYVKFHFFFLLC